MSSFRGLIVVSEGMASAFAVWGWNGTLPPVRAPGTRLRDYRLGTEVIVVTSGGIFISSLVQGGWMPRFCTRRYGLVSAPGDVRYAAVARKS